MAQTLIIIYVHTDSPDEAKTIILGTGRSSASEIALSLEIYCPDFLNAHLPMYAVLLSVNTL